MRRRLSACSPRDGDCRAGAAAGFDRFARRKKFNRGTKRHARQFAQSGSSFRFIELSSWTELCCRYSVLKFNFVLVADFIQYLPDRSA